MTIKFNQIVTHFQPEEALTVIEFLAQLQQMLQNTYGEQITAMLQETQQPWETSATFDDKF
jgi:hypothetical protein